jgi:hypothetical protein
MENKSQWIQADPCHFHHAKRNVLHGPYKQRASPPGRWCQVSRATPWQETHLAQTHVNKIETTLTKMYWLLRHMSKLSTRGTNFSQPAWTYRIKLSGTASTVNIEILECFQSKALRMIVDAPWYVPNMAIQRDLQTPTAKEEICSNSSQYRARLSAHSNNLVLNLMEQPDNRRLRRHLPNDLPTKFLL